MFDRSPGDFASLRPSGARRAATIGTVTLLLTGGTYGARAESARCDPTNSEIVSFEASRLQPDVLLGRDRGGRVVLVVLPDGRRRELAYDSSGRLSRETQVDGSSTEYEYDAFNRVSAEKRSGRRTAYLHARPDAEDPDYLVANLETASPQDEGRLREEIRRLATGDVGASPRFSYDAANGRLLAAENAFARIEYSYGPGPSDLGVSLVTRDFRFFARREQVARNVIVVRDEQGGAFRVSYRGLGTTEVARIESAGRTLFAREFDASGRVLRERFAGRFVVEYEYAGDARAWSRKVVRDAASGTIVDTLEARSGRTFLAGVRNEFTPEANRLVSPIPSRAVLTAPEGHAVAELTSSDVRWATELFDGPYASLDAQGTVISRTFGTSTPGTRYAGDQLVVTASSVLLVLEGAGAGRGVLEVPNEGVDRSGDGRPRRSPMMMVWRCSDPYRCCDVEGYNCQECQTCGWADDGGVGGGGGGTAGGGGGSLPGSPLPAQTSLAVNAAKTNARSRLSLETCANLFSGYGVTGLAIIGATRYRDGTNVAGSDGRVPCNDASVPAWTTVGSRTVMICPSNFRSGDWVTIIHEALHEAGLGENPPSPSEINAEVRANCSQT